MILTKQRGSLMYFRNYQKILLTACSVFLLSSGCKEKVIDVQPLKDPRTYTWTADTLAYIDSYQTNMSGIWASSPDDVYLVGHNDRSMGVMWHFDGNKWTDVKLQKLQGGNLSGAMSLSKIYGFAANNIYAIGAYIEDNHLSLLIHFDGASWKDVSIERGGYLISIHGNAPNDIWVVGDFNTIYHFDGISWKRDSIQMTIPPGKDLQVRSVASNNTGTFVAASLMNSLTGEQFYYLFKRTSNAWLAIDSTIGGNSASFGSILWTSPQGTLYSKGPSEWGKLIGHGSIRSLNGTSDNNLFAVGDYGTAYHFNGTNWQPINVVNDGETLYTGVWTDGKEAFIIGNLFEDRQKTIVWHGK